MNLSFIEKKSLPCVFDDHCSYFKVGAKGRYVWLCYELLLYVFLFLLAAFIISAIAFAFRALSFGVFFPHFFSVHLLIYS